MAAGDPDLTLDEVDALIDGAPSPKVLIVAYWTWFVIQAAGRDLKTRNNGGLNYRGLDVWISDRTRLGTAAETEWLQDF